MSQQTINFVLFFIDYVLAYEIDTDKDRDWQQKREEKRAEFEANLEKANLELEVEGFFYLRNFAKNVSEASKSYM